MTSLQCTAKFFLWHRHFALTVTWQFQTLLFLPRVKRVQKSPLPRQPEVFQIFALSLGLSLSRATMVQDQEPTGQNSNCHLLLMITAPACYQLLKTVALGNSAGIREQFQPQESHAHSCSFTICLKPRRSQYFVKIPGCPLTWRVPSAAPADVNLYVTDSVYQFVFHLFLKDCEFLLWTPHLGVMEHWALIQNTPLRFCTQRSEEMTVLNHVFEQDQVNEKINIITLSSQSSLLFSLSAAGYREGGCFWDEGITDSKPQVSLQSFHLDTSFYPQASSHVVHQKPSNLNCI